MYVMKYWKTNWTLSLPLFYGMAYAQQQYTKQDKMQTGPQVKPTQCLAQISSSDCVPVSLKMGMTPATQ